MYEVNLRTSPERLLDWDKPLSQQGRAGEIVNGLIPGKQWRLEPTASGKKFNILSPGGWQTNEFPGAYSEARARQIVEEMNAKSSGMARTGQQIAPRSPGAVQQFMDAGIDGVQYLDAGSRAAGDGTRNYVMFRDDIIDILRRYGLFGLGMMGAAGAKGGREQ